MGQALRTGRIVLLLSFAFMLAGCGLFGGSERERQEDNVRITEGIELGRVVTAEGIGADNAPINVTDRFNASQDFIYVVAQAEYIERGTSLFARWYRDGEPFEDSSEITANQDYRNTYIEFHLENLQREMEEGDYSVQIFVNGNPVESVDFTVE
jgi:hypothetical protein